MKDGRALINAIIKEEHHATEPITNTYPIEQSLKSLRKELEQEDNTFQYELKLMKSLTQECP
jgi:hypothetical protein